MDQLIFETQNAGYTYPGVAAPGVHGADFRLGAGELVGVVGPNGSGKTTLIRMLLGVLPSTGRVLVAGRPVAEWSRRDLARLVAVVVQREEPAFPLRVRQAVMLGRYPRLPVLAAPGKGDREAVDRALARCDLTDLADRWVATLSGGEWQRVRIARALAQEPVALVLDEATANLDLRHEMEVLELAAELTRRDRLAVLIVTHHVNVAARFVDRMVVVHRGRIHADGAPATVLTRETMERVFQWPVRTAELDGVPQIIPLRQTDRSN